MKRLICLLTCTILSFAAPPATVNDITYEFLEETAKQTGQCDTISHIRKIFENYKVKTLLEFGLGYSTKYFLDHCTKVISVEFITQAISPDWMKYCLDLYKGYSNWIPVSYFSNYPGDFSWAPYKFFGSTKLWEVEGEHWRNCNAVLDQAYLAELKTFISNLTKYNKVDLALVDPATTLRGPLAQLLFDKAPIILATDAAAIKSPNIPDTYAYCSMETPENYERIMLYKTQLTLLWIKKSAETEHLIQVMKEYAQTP